jgi:hypothetical protein
MHDGNNVRAKSVPAARKYVNSTYEYSRAESISHVSVTIYLEPNVFFNMDPKKLLSKLSTDQQEFYIFLAKECFSGFSNAEYNSECIVMRHVMHGLFMPLNSFGNRPLII